MSKSELQSKIEEAIKAKNLRPTAKWFFEATNAGLWLLGAAALLVGAVAVAVSFELLLSNDWDLAHELSGGKLGFLLGTVPYLWIGLVLLFLFVAEREVRRTRHGYRYATVHMGAALLLITLAGGGMLYAAGLGSATDAMFAETMPSYRQYGNRQYMIWSSPEKGRLAGVVAIVEDDFHFVLVDTEGGLWEVDATGATSPVPVTIAERKRLKLLGKQEAEMRFLARVVLPFHKGPEAPQVLEYRNELHTKKIDDYIRQSRERNFSRNRITE